MLRILTLLFALLLSGTAMAQAWPSRPIRIVVPFPPGGVTDVVARSIGKHVGDELGQPVVIDNRPGAGGKIGAQHVAESAPDGYTILLMTSGTHAILPVIDSKLGYDAERDFTPVLRLMASPFALYVNPGVPAKTIGEFLALARAQPGKLNYASAGTGTAHHMFFELFKAVAKIDIVHVSYRGEAPGVNDLLGGQVQAMMVPGGKQYADNGTLRPLAVTDSKRWFLLPEVPSLAEAGLADASIVGWSGLVMPPKTPADIVTRVNQVANNALRREDVAKILRDHGYEILGGTGAELTDWIRRDIAKWKRLVADANLKFD